MWIYARNDLWIYGKIQVLELVVFENKTKQNKKKKKNNNKVYT